MSRKTIKRFRLRDLLPYSTIAVIGPRGSGKTVIVKYYLYYKNREIRIPILISSTAQMQEDFKDMVPDLYIYENYNTDILSTVLNDQGLLKKKIEDGNCSVNVKKHSVIVMDDIVGTDPIWKKDTLFKRTFFAGRHYYMTNIISIQNLLHLPAEYRDNIDYIIVTAINTDKRKKFFFENYWNSRFGNYKEFCDIFDKIVTSAKYNFMLVNNRAAKKGECSTVDEYVFWGRTHDPKNLINRRVGHKFIWELNDKYYNKDWIIQQTMNELSNKKGLDEKMKDEKESNVSDIKLVEKKIANRNSRENRIIIS